MGKKHGILVQNLGFGKRCLKSLKNGAILNFGRAAYIYVET